MKVSAATVFHLRWLAVCAYLPGRSLARSHSLLLSPGVCPCFATALLYVWMLSLSRKDCCCILQQKERECAPVAAVRGSVSGLSVRRSARHQVEWTGTSLADASRCAPCSAADLRCKRLLGRAGTPCGHFSPRRCSSPFTLLRSRKPYSASHPPLRANACARRAAPRTFTASARRVKPSWDLQGPPSSVRVWILGDIFFFFSWSLPYTHS